MCCNDLRKHISSRGRHDCKLPTVSRRADYGKQPAEDAPGAYIITIFCHINTRNIDF